MYGSLETRVGIFVLAALAIFFYMGFQIGSFRFDRSHYVTYIIDFKDIGGLVRKSDVKTAGVKIGWVEQVLLTPGPPTYARAHIMILKEYTLYSNAHAVVRQDGLLGPKYIELIVGDPLSPPLEPGTIISKPSVEPTSVDELLHQFKKIATNVSSVTESLKDTIGSSVGKTHIKSVIDNVSTTAENLSDITHTINRALGRNEHGIDELLTVGSSVKKLSEKLEHDILPAFQSQVEKIAGSFDRDFGRIAHTLEKGINALEDTTVQTRDGMKSITSIAVKIDEGKGIFGKLINEDETYRDLKTAIHGFKNYLSKFDRLTIIFDSHSESMCRPAENYVYEDSKGYFDMRIYPNEDHFYVLQLASSEKGFVDRDEYHRIYSNKTPDYRHWPDLVDVHGLTANFRPLKDLYRQEKTTIHRNGWKIGLQFGKVFSRVSFRFGLFEGFAGCGFDIDIPFKSDKFRWITTVEMFDWRGWNRLNDKRPHFKWLNRTFLLRNLYTVFGADDFISKHNGSIFFGIGLRFGDDDVKYLFSGISGLAGSVTQ